MSNQHLRHNHKQLGPDNRCNPSIRKNHRLDSPQDCSCRRWDLCIQQLCTLDYLDCNTPQQDRTDRNSNNQDRMPLRQHRSKFHLALQQPCTLQSRCNLLHQGHNRRHFAPISSSQHTTSKKQSFHRSQLRTNKIQLMYTLSKRTHTWWCGVEPSEGQGSSVRVVW